MLKDCPGWQIRSEPFNVYIPWSGQQYPLFQYKPVFLKWRNNTEADIYIFQYTVPGNTMLNDRISVVGVYQGVRN